MGLAELIDATKDGPGNRCRISILRLTLSPEDLDTLDAALADPSIQTTRIHAALRAMGYDIGAHSLQRHRRGACKCER